MALMISIKKLVNGNIVEQNRIEYKNGWDPEPIVHSICAFANDLEGYGVGYIIIGVNAVEGVPTFPVNGIEINQIDHIQNQIIEYCKKCISPNYLPNIDVVEYDDAKLIVLSVYEGYDKPYTCLENVYKKDSKNRYCYVREGSQTIKATQTEIKELIRSAEIISFDDRLNRRASIDDIKPSLVREFLYDTGSGLASRFDEMNLLDVYKSLRIIGGPNENTLPKNVGILMFNDNPHKIIPYSYIVVDYIPNPTGEDIITKTFYGPLHRQLKDAIQYIKNNYLEKLIEKLPNRTESITTYNYPSEVIDELLPNAVLHKDYQIGEPITVRITNESIDITSFPGLDFTISDDRIKANNFISKYYRNKRIAEFLRDLELIEAKNTGFPKVIKALKDNKSKDLVIEMDNERRYLSVQVFKNEKFNRPINSVKTRNLKVIDRVLEVLAEEDMTLTQISNKLEYKSIPTSLKKAIANLVDEGKIEKDGSKYKLIK